MGFSAGLSVLLLLQASSTEPRDLSTLVGAIREKYHLPALGAAVVTARGIEAVGADGRRDWNADAPVTIGDQWHLGSCTKAITATLAGRLVDRGLIRFETTVGQVFGPSVPNLHPGWRDVPLLWLLTHRSGAPRNFPGESLNRITGGTEPPRSQRQSLVAEALTLAPATAPNSVTVYSNAGYIIAGAMMEAVTGESWETLITREVFAPLGMTRSGFGPPGTPGQLDQPRGHTRDGDRWSPVGLGPAADNPAAIGPAGTIHTTLADWARFIAAHLRGASGDESFLSKAGWRRLHTAGGSDWGYSAGWVVPSDRGGDGLVLRHLGSNHFWVAEAIISLGKGVATLVVTNSGDDSAEPAFKELAAVLLTDRARDQ